MKNLMLEPVKYRYDETRRGTWRRFVYPTGELFEEFVSHERLFGLPMIHYTRGPCPETGKRVTARGVFAFGRVAVGVVAFGQAAFGLIAFGQLALGVVFGLGQASTGVVAIGQLAIGLAFGLGQFTTGYVSVGQLGFGRWVLAQVGTGGAVWDTRAADPAAKQFFQGAWGWFRGLFLWV
jgi:hypothetical protein